MFQPVEVTAATISNSPAGEIVRLSPEKIELYPFHPERAYNHHPQITAFKGRLYASWSNGYENEDDCGQRVMVSTSTNFEEWTPPKPLLDTKMGKYSELVVTSGGFYTDGEILNLYFHAYEYDPYVLRGVNLRPLAASHRILEGACSMYVITTEDGERWSEPMALPIDPYHLNTPPVKNSTGRLIMCAGVDFSYTDDPKGLGGWVTARLSETGIENAIGSGARLLTEGSYYEAPDGVLRMLLRTNMEYLYVSESHDNGESWSDPYRTNFTDAGSKFYLNNLPDGRIYHVGNPVAGSNRNPLAVSTSVDGIHFDKRYLICDKPVDKRKEGMYKGGIYGYPNAVVHDGYLYVIYSVWKETVEIVRIALGDLI